MIRKHKIVVLLISLLAAVAFWLYVVTTVAPDTKGSVSGISVSVIGDTTLEARGLMITDMGTNSVWVELEGSRATLSKLNSNNLNATMDVSRITEAGEYDLSYTVSFPDTVNTGEIQLLRKSVDTIHLTVSNIATKILPLELQWSGQVQDGYLFDEGAVVFEPENITLQGPDFEVNEVARVVTTYDVSELTRTVELQSAPIFLDALGNEITLSDLTTVSTTDIFMTVPVSMYKDITMVLDLTYGAGINEDNVSVTLNPETVRVSGDPEVIEAMSDTLHVGSLDLNNVDDGDTFVFTLMLPRGVTNVSGESQVLAKVQYTGLTYRQYTITDIELIYESEELEAILNTRAITVRLRGSKSILDTIDPEDIHIKADLADYTQSGTYTVKATVEIDGNPDVGFVGEVELIVTLS